MEEPPEAGGPNQCGRGVSGQYVYWITAPRLTDAQVAAGYKQPADFSRQDPWGRLLAGSCLVFQGKLKLFLRLKQLCGFFCCVFHYFWI